MAKKSESKKAVKASKPVKNSYKRPNINLLATIAVLFVVLFVAIFQLQYNQELRGRAQVAPNDCTVSDVDALVTSQEHVLVDLVNQYRQASGSSAMQLSPSLNRDAAWLTKDMHDKNYFNHTDSLGRSLLQRAIDCGQPVNTNDEENLYQGAGGAQAAFDFWKNSTQGHNEAMLRPSNLFMGVANDGDYWSMTLSPINGNDVISPQPSVLVSPSSVVPSPQCLGGVCPTATIPMQPTQTVTDIPTSIPTATVIPSTVTPSSQPYPTSSVVPSVEPSQPVTTPPAGGGGNQGLIGLLLAFLMLILQFFKSLFGM